MTEQAKLDMIRQVLQAIGSVLTVLGILSPEAVAQWINTIMLIAGPLMMVAVMAWGLLTNKESSVISQVANMDQVKKVELVSSASPALVQATPNNVTKA